ncbi:MAG: NAD(P)-dependent alcohol dehydrogenase [Deltaproteobacteria bacterium]|nr:NAD(P)-dependent alcohol dehydrogenase [Deltaproteobacteria bacterium]
MKAIVSSSPDEPLEARDLPEARLRPNELRVRVQAAGVNPADWKMRSYFYLGVARRVIGAPGPFVPGIDFAGIVESAGSSVGFPRVGDRVMGSTDFSRRQRGSYAEYVHVRPDQVAILPPEVSAEEAACLPVPGVTAYRGLFDLGGLSDTIPLDPKQRSRKVLVLGASGGVGHLAVQLAHSRGCFVAGVCSAKNAELVERLGGLPIDYRSGDALSLAEAQGPFDVIVDCVGSQAYPTERCERLLTQSGILVLFMPRLHDARALFKVTRVKTLLVQPRSNILDRLVSDLAEKRIRVVIADRIPLSEAERAHAISKSGHVVGKLVLVG